MGELKSFAATGSPFIDDGEGRLAQFIQDLVSLCQSNRLGKSQRWSIPADRPVQTVVAPGGGEPGNRRGKHQIRGELSGSWEITPLGKKKKVDRFCLTGNASIRARVVDVERHVILAQWQNEVAAHDSPGCHFHIGVGQMMPLPDVGIPLANAEESFGAFLFPSSLSIPRFPTCLVSFVDAMDFLLGEVFQDGWLKRVDEDRSSKHLWVAPQQTRLAALLDWQRRCVEDANASGSAWQRLKKSQPVAGLFTPRSR